MKVRMPLAATFMLVPWAVAMFIHFGDFVNPVNIDTLQNIKKGMTRLQVERMLRKPHKQDEENPTGFWRLVEPLPIEVADPDLRPGTLCTWNGPTCAIYVEFERDDLVRRTGCQFRQLDDRGLWDKFRAWLRL